MVLARGLYYWPGMVNDIKQLISSCSTCSRMQASQPFTPMVTPPPSTHLGYPMQHVGLYLFSFGTKQYLICVNHWSGYPLYSPLRSLSSDAIISTLSSWFNILGWPSSIRSDGGPQFRGPFSSFCSRQGIKHKLITLKVMILRKPVLNQSKTYYASATKPGRTPILCYMNGGIPLVRLPPAYIFALTTPSELAHRHYSFDQAGQVIL